ncbi:hypothetical protein GGP41_007689 [Bipolaris sorokiniana]|uniref:Proteophosphoglycan 5 n=2 Tax=Cochliobolus sativus TaxID=45130 RepID=A0A8H6DR14_COCSA|nr:uncharacterized protein COCSADRAFT_291347 [Bipolaris sorokiniana ND90Pr]EMD67645.1 hypothetical protein COCSADRAFT_291347 [Bipolaris sorokiniana ND90Pr]KAF5844638.1 hypothetical protein GGP41_007689 [Bipolaris sorokiniana]
MSTTQITASPRAPRGKPQSPAQLPQNNNAGRQSQRKPRNNRVQNGYNQRNGLPVSPSKNSAQGALAESVTFPCEDGHMSAGSRGMKKHTQPKPSDRVSPPAESDPVPINPSATPIKIQAAYAGPTFHASPAPSALPIPKFLSRSVPAKTRAGPPTPPPEDSSDSGSLSPSASPSRAPMAAPPRHEQSPLDLLFRADAAERANNQNRGLPSNSPFVAVNPGRSHHFKHDSYHSLNGIFPIELDGESKHAHMSPAPPAASTSQRSMTDPDGVPQLKDVHQQGNGNDVIQDLFSRLSMSQKKPTAATPPRAGVHGPPGPQAHLSPSPFHDGRTPGRTASGPTTPQAQPTNQDPSDFYYGNKNLSPLFKAAQGDSAKRNSGLRTEISADSPMLQQDGFKGFASVSQPHPMGPNGFPQGNGATPNAPRQAGPSMPPYQQSPNQRRTPGRQPHQRRPDNYQTRGQRTGSGSGPGPKFDKAAANGSPASAPKSSTTMMSFVPSSVAAKQRKTSAPTAPTAAPAMKTSTPSETLALEQDLKRLLNLNTAGDASTVR